MTAPTAARLLYEPPPLAKNRAPRRIALLAGFLGMCVVTSLGLRLATDGPAPVRSPARGAAAAQLPAASEAQDEASATADAVRFVTAYGSAAMYDPAQRARVLSAITSPQVRGQLGSTVDAAFALAAEHLGLDGQGRSSAGELVARAVPVGTRTVSFTPTRAVIAVWTTGLLGVAGLRSTTPVQETWSTETVTLDWTPQGWRWLSFEHADGPAPIGSPQVPATADAIARAARDLREVTGAP